jgi:hypothetical protein
MNPMQRESDSSPKNNQTWLQPLYEQKKARSLQLGIKAIDDLRKSEGIISYATVAKRSRELDQEGNGIHPNTLRKNTELMEYFLKYRTSKYNKPLKRSAQSADEELDEFRNIKQDRDIDRVKQRYMKYTKPELVDLIIRMEQYIERNNRHWIKDQFEKFIK